VRGDGVALLHRRWLLEPSEQPTELRIELHSRRYKPLSTRIAIKRYHQKTTLTLPMAGRWRVLDGHRAYETHASLHLSSQQFAYDLVRFAENGLTHRGEPKSLRSYLAYGEPVLAMAPGTVVAVNDGVSDNRIGHRPSWRALLRRPRDLAGNYVVLEHRPKEYTAYFHLQRGLQVKVGQNVQRGQKIGLCGNSGNSGEPHIHVQLQDGPDPMRASGLPALFSQFGYAYGASKRFATRPRPLPWRLPIWLREKKWGLAAQRTLMHIADAIDRRYRSRYDLLLVGS
jgi:hypothetical protein